MSEVALLARLLRLFRHEDLDDVTLAIEDLNLANVFLGELLGVLYEVAKISAN